MALKCPTQKRLKELFDYDPSTGDLIRKTNRFGPNCKAGNPTSQNINSSGYLRVMVDGVRYPTHRLIWVYVHGGIAEHLVIDHINRDKTDNRICNLREVTFKQNSNNVGMYKSNSSGKKGVYWHKRDKYWHVSIRVNDRLKHIGCFIDREAADLVRDMAEEKYCIC